MFRCNPEHLVKSYLVGQLVIRGLRKAMPAEVIIILEGGTTLPDLARRDVVGEKTRQPHCVITKVSQHQESAFPLGLFQVSENVNEISVPLVVVPVHSHCAVAPAEFKKNRSQIIGHVAIIETVPEQRVTNRYIKEKGLGGDQHRANRQQPLEQIGRVKQSVRPLGGQKVFPTRPLGRAAAGKQQNDQPQVIGGEPGPRIRAYHTHALLA